MGVISNGTTLLDAGALDSGVATGSMTLIKTLTASSSGTLSFVNGASNVVLDGTYKEYVFKIINIHPSESASFTVGFRDGGSNYDAAKITTFYYARHGEDDGSAELVYRGGTDTVGTGAQQLMNGIGNSADDCGSGYLHLFDPASTSSVKHFIATTNIMQDNVQSVEHHIAGFCNVTAAIDAVQFSVNSGNIDSGTISLYGIA